MNLLISLPLGVLAIIASYFLLSRTSSFPRSGILLSLALTVIVVCVGYSIIVWPGADVLAIHLAVYLLTLYGLMIITSRKSTDKKWHWAPITIISFFIVIFITDSVFIYLAQNGLDPKWSSWILPEPSRKIEVRSVFPGVVSHNFRQRGIQFNTYQQNRLIQKQLNWDIKLGWATEAQAGQGNTLYLQLKDQKGQLLNDANIQARFLYPADMHYDKEQVFKAVNDGLYAAEIVLRKPGDWDVIVDIQHDNEQYELRAKTTIK